MLFFLSALTYCRLFPPLKTIIKDMFQSYLFHSAKSAKQTSKSKCQSALWKPFLQKRTTGEFKWISPHEAQAATKTDYTLEAPSRMTDWIPWSKAPFPLQTFCLRAEDHSLVYSASKIVISLLQMEIVWWQRSQSPLGVAEYIRLHFAICVTKKKTLNLLAEDSSNIISHEAFRGNDELQRENILGKAMSSESVPHCRELSGWVISLTVYEPC